MFENTKMYPGFAGIAKNASFPEIARTSNRISSVEKGHDYPFFDKKEIDSEKPVSSKLIDLRIEALSKSKMKGEVAQVKEERPKETILEIG